jgi:CRISPR-associated exonuclease Cas4
MIIVSDVKQYLYCPKIIYFDHVLHIPKPPDQKLETGKEKHDSITAKERRRKGALFYDPELDQAEKMFRVALESSSLGLRGVLDYLVKTEREFIPVDYKFSSSHNGGVHLNHKYQLAAYALLVEDNFNTIIRRGFIHYSKDRSMCRSISLMRSAGAH